VGIEPREPDVFALKMGSLVDKVTFTGLRLGKVDIGDILNQVMGLVRHHRVQASRETLGG
jgi:hypothetical protein